MTKFFAWAVFIPLLCMQAADVNAFRVSRLSGPLTQDLGATQSHALPDLGKQGLTPTAVVLKGTPLNRDATHFSVLSYNLLAPVFVRHVDKRTGQVQEFAAFHWAEAFDEVLAWEARQPRLLAELHASGADAICLQEVQFEQTNDDVFVIPSWLKLKGYKAVLPDQAALSNMAKRNKRVLDINTAVGNVILYRTDRLEVCSNATIYSTNTRVAALLKGRPGTMLEPFSCTAVFSVHLDAVSEDKRVEQVSKCFGIARHAGTRELVIAGDMNTECLPGSCVGAFFSGVSLPATSDLARECAKSLRLDGKFEASRGSHKNVGQTPNDEQLKAWRDLQQKAIQASLEHGISLSHLETGATRSGYDHGKNSGPCVSWCLDHIFYSARSLQLKTSWAALEADEESAAVGLPNRNCPSDHLPIAATFQPLQVPRLNCAEAVELVNHNAIDARQPEESQLLREMVSATESSPTTAAPVAAAKRFIGKPAENDEKPDRPWRGVRGGKRGMRVRRLERELAAQRETVAKAWDVLVLDVVMQCLSDQQLVDSDA